MRDNNNRLYLYRVKNINSNSIHLWHLLRKIPTLDRAFLVGIGANNYCGMYMVQHLKTLKPINDYTLCIIYLKDDRVLQSCMCEGSLLNTLSTLGQPITLWGKQSIVPRVDNCWPVHSCHRHLYEDLRTWTCMCLLYFIMTLTEFHHDGKRNVEFITDLWND